MIFGIGQSNFFECFIVRRSGIFGGIDTYKKNICLNLPQDELFSKTQVCLGKDPCEMIALDVGTKDYPGNLLQLCLFLFNLDQFF